MSYKYALGTMETRITDYFAKVLGGMEGYQAFTFDKFPRTIKEWGGDVTKTFLFEFRLGGGPMPQRQNRTQQPAGAWVIEGQFRAHCYNREIANEIIGVLMDSLPAKEADIKGLSHLYMPTYPTKQRIPGKITGGNNAGQDDVIVEVTAQLVAAFGNTEQTE